MSGAFPEGRGVPLRRSTESGLITLEWLLVVGAIAGLAASSVVIVQQVLDDHSEVPADPLVRMLEADVAAAWVAAEAQATFDAQPGAYNAAVNHGFDTRCQGVGADFADVVANALWFSPWGPDGVPANADDVPARCVAVPYPDLGA